MSKVRMPKGVDRTTGAYIVQPLPRCPSNFIALEQRGIVYGLVPIEWTLTDTLSLRPFKLHPSYTPSHRLTRWDARYALTIGGYLSQLPVRYYVYLIPDRHLAFVHRWAFDPVHDNVSEETQFVGPIADQRKAEDIAQAYTLTGVIGKP